MKNEVCDDFEFHRKGKYRVSNRIFLDLVFNNACNCNCPFCIARTKTYSENDPEAWKKAVKKTLEIFREEIDSMIILGGEATIDPDFFVRLDWLDEMTEGDHIFTILTTNGIMLKDSSFLNRLKESSIDSVNISVMHYDQEKNDRLMGARTLTKEQLRQIRDELHRVGKTVRFNTNVAKNNLDSVEEMEEYVKAFKGCFDAVKFTPLMKTDMFGTTDAVLAYTHEYALSKEEIRKLFDGFADRHQKNRFNNNVFGLISYGDVTAFGEHVILKYEQVEDMYDLDDTIPTLKLYPNGCLSNEWSYRKNILGDF